jgi:uncharacterized protein YyaL (SSP411 family)
MRASRGGRTTKVAGFVLTLLLTQSLAAQSVTSQATTNRLANATSRYLRQHATNPVDWYPWGTEAFEKAKRENKPVFLSIGYSTCHWCHVMEKESFADPEIAKLMNEAFVSIKVDREERPDLDSVYLAVTRTLTGDAGWPNNVILTPEGKPFYAAAYIPKEKFRVLIPRLAAMWSTQREQVAASAEMIVRTLQEPRVAGESLTAEVLMKGFRQLETRFDGEHGGFLPEPKFPKPHDLMFLLRYWKRTGEASALSMVEQTLRAMRSGNLWDAQDLGFHRYVSDAAWREPHYEKMLYDQALLAMLYLEAYQATGKDEYAKTARDTFTYVMRELRGSDGAFFAAQDADEAYYTAKDRAKRRRPGRDEKILVDWNGLMIAALANGSVILEDPKLAEAAKQAATAVLSRKRRFLDDSAFLTWGLLNLYEATFELRWLEQAIAVHDDALQRFGDSSGRFFVTAANDERLLVRPRETGDGAIPAGNSVMVLNLIRLARMTANEAYEKRAHAALRTVSDDVHLAPSTFTHLLNALSFVLGPSQEIVLAGDDVRTMQRAVNRPFAPDKVVLHRPAGDAPPIVKIAPFTEPQRPIGGKATAYVCTNYLCRMPVTDPGKLTIGK